MPSSKRVAFVIVAVFSLMLAGLVAWNLTSAPTLAAVARHATAPQLSAYNSNNNNQDNGSNREVENLLPGQPSPTPPFPAQSRLNEPAQLQPQAQPSSSRPISISNAPVSNPTPIPMLIGTDIVVEAPPKGPAQPAPAQPVSPHYENLLPQVPIASATKNTSKTGPSTDTIFIDTGGPAVGKIVARNGELVDSRGTRFFVAGINYEGHTDRAWLMWQNDKFDPNLINQNFGLAQSGGFNAVRLFVQTQLRDDTLAGNFTKIDKVVELAQQHGLRLLITLGDYYEPDLSKLIQVDSALARHLAGSGTILGYDLRNEPQFGEFVASVYPDGQQPAMQTDELIRAYGERMSQAATDAWRNGAGHNLVPAYLNSHQAYIYVNMLRYHEEILNDMGDWLFGHKGATAMDYFGSPEAAKWNAYVGALNATIQRYIDLRQGAILAVDPGRLVTIGYNRQDLVYAPANRSLGFISFHNFPGDQAGGLAQTLAILNFLKNYFSAKPVVMEEFGYSNSDGKNPVAPLRTASYETSIWLFLYGRGYAGGFKWMLNNFTIGANPYENNFGLLDDQTQPKPAYYAERAVLQMADANRTPTGDFDRLETYDGVTISYGWGSSNAFFGNGKEFKDARLQLIQAENAPWAVWWPTNGLGNVSVSLTTPGLVVLDLQAIFPGWHRGINPTLSQSDGTNVNFEQRSASMLAFQAQPGVIYTLKAPVQPAAFQTATPLSVANTLYFKETGHNLSNYFKKYWEAHGGLALYGYPVSEEFKENGFVVQYFERARFEYHPEYGGTPNEVQLGLLGSQVTAGRKEKGDAAFQPVAKLDNTSDLTYFPQTYHSLRGGFKTFWETHGGLAQFGYPITEEFLEVNPADGKTYTVQYFERNRFEWHPEFKNTPAEFQLGLLGLQVVRGRGWMS